MIDLKQMSQSEVSFVFECLKELRGSVQYSLADFEKYVADHRLMTHPEYQIFVGYDGDIPVGILTCNRFSMPRYLGFGYELEEVVVGSQFQGKGYGKLMMEGFLSRVKEDGAVRKVLVKTDDQARAGKLYEKYFDVVTTTVYARTINYL